MCYFLGVTYAIDSYKHVFSGEFLVSEISEHSVFCRECGSFSFSRAVKNFGLNSSKNAGGVKLYKPSIW